MLITWFVGKSWISQRSIFKVDRFYLCSIITGRNEVVAKVMFLLVSVILYTGGWLSQHALHVVSQHALQQVSRGVCYPSTHCKWYPSMPWSRSPGGCLVGGAWSRGLLWGGAWSGGVPASGGCLLQEDACSQGMCGLLLWSSGLVAFWFGCLLVWWPSDWRCPSGLVAFWFGCLLIEGDLLVESGLLLWPSGVISVMAFWYGLLVRPSGTGLS